LFVVCLSVPSAVFARTTLTVTGTVPNGTATEAYTATIKASGGTGPYTYQGSSIPKALKLSQSTGVISGIPSTVGQFTFTIYATDSAGNHGNGSFTVTFAQPPVSISVAPATPTIPSAGTQQFVATVLNTSNTSVTWATTGGSISPAGSLTAPSVTRNTTVTVTATSAADSTKKASANVTVSPSVTTTPVALEVVSPPTGAHQPYYQDVQNYLMNNPLVAGVIFYLEWSSADNGPSANPQYDFTAFDVEIAGWIGAGKKVNIVVWPVSDKQTNTATPQYVFKSLGSSNTTTCGGEQIPNYYQSVFQLPYEAFMKEVVKHYGANGSIGYIRFGLARGGETFPAPGFGTDPCTNTFVNKWGWSVTTWTNYVDAMLNFESTMKSPKQLMVGIDGVESGSMPDSEAATAVSLGIGFGNQGMQASDMSNYPNCSSNWCALFAQYSPSVPMELQTIQASSPQGGPPVGSLVPLLPFAASQHATVLEIYCDDWLLAFDPNYPGYSTYGAAYAAAFKQAAQGK